MASNMRIFARRYTQAAIEAWLEQLDVDWRSTFEAETLEAARRLYREGHVTHAELSSREATVHLEFQGGAIYVVLEAGTKGIAWRASIKDEPRSAILAAAALYEIEELVISEASDLPADNLKKSLPKAGKEGMQSQGAGEPHCLASEKSFEDSAKTQPTPIPIQLDFKLLKRGLLVRAFEQDGGALINLCKDGTLSAKAKAPNGPKRKAWVNFALKVHQAGFRYCPELHGYLLEHPNAIVRFASEQLMHWRRFFDIKMSAELNRIRQAPREIELSARAEARGSGFALAWQWSMEGKALKQTFQKHLLKADAGALVSVPNLGIVRLGDEAHKSAKTLRRLSSGLQGPLPYYMLFSNMGEVRLELNAELENWYKQVKASPAAKEDLPDFLRDYQRYGVAWMEHLLRHGCHVLLADEMGLGKTLQILSLIRTFPIGNSPSLVICPSSVIPVWKAEAAKFFPDLVVKTLQKDKAFSLFKGGSENSKRSKTIYLASYAQLRWRRALFSEIRFAYAILDEAQQVKNPETKTARICWDIQASRRVALTGTPLENRWRDLWSIFRFLMPGLLGSLRHFERLALENCSTEQIQRQLSPFLLRRDKDTVARELPKRVDSILTCPLSNYQKNEYKRLVQAAYQEDPNGNPLHILTRLTRLRQLCCDPGLLPTQHGLPLIYSGKLQVLKARLIELSATGSKVVVFSQFVSLLRRVRRLLDEDIPELECLELTGRSRNRAKIVEDFQNFEGAAVLLGSLRAAGVGITLHAAQYVFLLDPWWNPALEEQAIDRVHRIGQRKTVFAYRMIAAGTLEERIQELKEDKKALLASILNAACPEDFRERLADLAKLKNNN